MSSLLDGQLARNNAHYPARFEQITPHVTREWLDDGQFVVFDIRSVARTDVDATYAIMAQTMREWSPDKPYLAINDFSRANSILSPYAQKHLRAIRLYRPELKGYIAIVMPRGLVANVVRIFVRANPGARQNEMFYKREDALAWLRLKAR